MSKIFKINIFLLSTLVLSLVLPSFFPIFADSAPVQRFFCLAAKKNGTHNALLSIDPAKYTAIPGDIYVFVRLNNLLTTGNPTLDSDHNVLGSSSNYDALVKSLELKDAGLVDSVNPVPSSANLPVDWHDDLNPNKPTAHFWFGMQLVPPTQPVVNGAGGALQQGTFNWAVNAGDSVCASIKWDPLGYVFDAQTLGVIPGAIVTIYDASKTPPVKVPTGPGVGQVATNPFPTLDNGTFSFFTSPGTYSLTIGGKYNGVSLIIAGPSTVNQNYKADGYTNLYSSDTPIVEAEGQTVRTDIAVNTVGAPAPIPMTPTIEDINIIGAGENTQVSGTVVPYAPDSPTVKVVPVYVEPTTLAEQNGTDTIPINVNGEFSSLISSSMQVGDETYVINRLDLKNISTALRKDSPNAFIAALTKIKDLLFVVHAAQSASSVVINPIPSYLEGIAQDSKGAVLSNVLVGIYLQGSNVSVYQTSSDVNGHYVIGSQYIPILPYEIHLTLANGEVVSLTTMEYLKQNANFHKQNTINSFATVQTNSSINNAGILTVTKTVISPVTANTNKSNVGNSKGNGSSGYRNGASQVTPTGGITTSGMQGIIMIAVAIMVLLMIGVGAFVMMKSKQSQMPPQQ